MNAPAYIYSAVDRLAEPIKYMYTPYEGSTFLRAYFADRHAFLGEAPASADEALAGAARALGGRPGGWGEPGTTAARLAEAAQALLAGVPRSADLDEMLRKYEVTKKLHRAYPGDRKGEGGYLEMAPYVLLSLGCGIVAHRGGTLKYLNAQLKAGDCVISRRSALDAHEAEAARHALALEVLAVRALMDSKGVRA